MMFEKLGNIDEMELLFKCVIVLKFDYVNVYNVLGYLLVDCGVWLEELCSLIVKVFSYVLKEFFFIDSMGWVEFKFGNCIEVLCLLCEVY